MKGESSADEEDLCLCRRQGERGWPFVDVVGHASAATVYAGLGFIVTINPELAWNCRIIAQWQDLSCLRVKVTFLPLPYSESKSELHWLRLIFGFMVRVIKSRNICKLALYKSSGLKYSVTSQTKG